MAQQLARNVQDDMDEEPVEGHIDYVGGPMHYCITISQGVSKYSGYWYAFTYKGALKKMARLVIRYQAHHDKEVAVKVAEQRRRWGR